MQTNRNKDNKKQVKEQLKFLAAVFLAVPFLTALFSAMAGLTPLGGKKFAYNFTATYIALGLNITFWSFALAYRFSNKKTVWSWLFWYGGYVTLIPGLAGVTALNWVYGTFPTWMVIGPLGAMYVIAALLPFINEKLSETLHTEMVSPRSCLGRIIYISLMSLAPIAGVFGAFLSGLAERSGGVTGYTIMGFAFHFLFVWGTVSMAHQAWERRPWAAEKE